MVELHWFKPNKYLPFVPLGLEGYLTYFIMLCLVVFSFFYFDLLNLSFDRFVYFIISIVFVLALFFVLSKNTSEEKVIPRIIPKKDFHK